MEEIDLASLVEGGDGIHVVRGSGDIRAWNGIRYAAGLSAKNVPAKHLSMNVPAFLPAASPTRTSTSASR